MANQIPIFDFSFGGTVENIEKLTEDLKKLKQTFKTLNPKDANFLTLGNEIKVAENQLKTLNAVTKDGVNSLGGINKEVKFAGGSYGELKQKIELAKKALLDMNTAEIDGSNELKELNALQNQRIEIEKKIPSLFQERIKGAIDESNSLKQLKADLKSAQSAALNGDGQAAKKVAELKDKIDDLKDSTKSLQGSGVERLNTSMQLLTQGFADFDAEKVKTGFKGIGAAMSAIPLILLIEGIKALIENFSEVVKFAKEITNTFSASEQAVRNLTLATEAETIANKGLISQYDNQIELLTAQGGKEKEITELKKKKILVEIAEAENIVSLNAAKVAEVLLNDSITESINRVTASLLRKIGQDDAANALEKVILQDKKERAKEELKSIQDAQIGIAASKTALQVLDIEDNKKQIESAKKTAEEKKKIWLEEADSFQDKVLEEQRIEKENSNELQKIWENESDIWFNIQLENNQKDKDLKQQQLYDNVTIANTNLINARLEGGDLLKAKIDKLNAEKEIELANAEDSEVKKAEIAAKYREQENQLKASQYSNELQQAESLVNSLAALSDSLYVIRRSNLQKGSEEDRRLAKQQFDVNKAFAIGTTLINGAVAVTNAFATLPYYANIIAAAAAGVTTTASVAKISAQKFQYFDGGFTQQGDPTEQAESIGNSQFHKGEYVIPNKVLSTPTGGMMASQLESMRKGFSKSNISGFFDGGFTARSASSTAMNNSNLQNSILESISSMPAPIVKVTDINKVSRRNEVSVNVSGL